MSTARIHALRRHAVIRFTGDDAQSFLQGQLTCEVAGLAPQRSTYGSYCTPKGRILATFLLWRTAECFFMQLPLELCSAVHKRISMYILRSKVKAIDESDARVCLGIDGEGARALLERALGTAPPSTTHEVIELPGVSVIALPGERFAIVAAADRVEGITQALLLDATEAAAEDWTRLDIEAGIPVITAATQEQFVPQMVNLDLIGGVSFAKGCYPGQEIVARMHYLGRLKQRMYLAHVASGAPPAPGDRLYSAAFGDQACGAIVNAAANPAGGFLVLAVAQIDEARDGNLHLATLDGPALRLLPLPYSVRVR